MKKNLYWLIGLLIYWFIPAPLALAAGEFQADYDVAYAVATSGTTIVTQRVTLTNKQSNLYPKQYAVIIDTEKINDVIAHDDGGVIIPQIKQADGKTNILLTFNQKVVGLGQQLIFTLRFQNQDIAQHNGNIWEINIPGVAADPDLGSYNVSLDVPPTFGPNAYLSPLPADGRKWNKDQMLRGGVCAAYGKKQLFLLDLSYFLENPKVAPLATEIALPPDTAFQKVEILSLDPRPVNVRRDDDGNWLARFNLLPGALTRVKAKLLIEVYLTARGDFKVTAPDPAVYTQPAEYWEASDPKITSLSRNFKTPQAIYNYVVSTLEYDYGRVSQNPVRKGALAALASPQESICMEFTDLFVALARAAGIPAREAVGFAYTTNAKLRPLSLVSDVLHSWPEYYDRDSQLWVPVDPTWGNTTGGVNYFDKLDFNHIVFAIHGLSSNFPYPAGFYRENGKNTKDVNVQFTDKTIDKIQGNLITRFDFPKTAAAGFLANGSVTVENTSGLAVDKALVSIRSSPFSFSLTREEQFLPPFARVVYPINFMAGNYLTRASGQIEVSVNGQTQNYYFSVQPFFWLLIPAASLGVGLICLAWFVSFKLRLWKRRA